MNSTDVLFEPPRRDKPLPTASYHTRENISNCPTDGIPYFPITAPTRFSAVIKTHFLFLEKEQRKQHNVSQKYILV